MTAARHAARIAVVLGLGVILAACGGSDAGTTAAPEDDAAGSASDVESVLVIDGKEVGADGRVASEPTVDPDAKRPRRVRTTDTRDTIVWEAPPLNDDGTIDDGPDPFAGTRVPVQAIPIEDDPSTTAGIDTVARNLRRVSPDDWSAWLRANDDRSPWEEGDDAFAQSIVDITVERCGGARTVATGAVIADETVVTTVHAVESAAKRVRVSSSVGDGPRIPAMVRYLDVDDDVAVLKVPGLRVRPMPIYTPSGTAPRMGYAYGVANVGMAGALRRTPVMVTLQETTAELEQPDGFAERISSRPVQTLVGGVTTGFSGGVVAVTNDDDLSSGFGLHGLVRARVPFRADTAAVVIPSRIVRDAVTASGQLDQWFEHRPGGCPQWKR